MKCMERILLRIGAAEKQAPSHLNCVGEFCGNRFDGIKSLTSYYAEIAKAPAPSLKTPSSKVVSRTLQSHPDAQCRFDTMIAALKCSDRLDFDYQDDKAGACQTRQGSRPRCWFYTN